MGLVVPRYLSGNSFLQPPLGMMLAASRLRANGVDVVLLDLRAEPMTDAELLRRLNGCTLVMVTTTPYDQVQNYFLDYRYTLTVKLVRVLRERLPERTSLCVCGSHGTVRPDLVLRDCGVDLVMRGEYDILIPELVESLLGSTALPASVVTPENIAEVPIDLYRPTTQTLGCPHLAEARPAYDLVDLSRYYGDGYRDGLPYRRTGWATILANRGCPYRCDFCFNAWGRQVRRRDPSEVVAEMLHLQDTYSMRAVFFIDFTFTANHDWVFEFCREYRRCGLSISWVCETRVDTVTTEVLADMAGSGCEAIWYGVESFDADIVASAHKYRADNLMLNAIEMTSLAGIAPHAFIMIGLPGETLSTLEHTRDTISKLRVPYTKSVIVATPRYGTEYFRTAQAQYPNFHLEEDFLRLLAVRGLVGNEMTPCEIQQAVSKFRDRESIFRPVPSGGVS